MICNSWHSRRAVIACRSATMLAMALGAAPSVADAQPTFSQPGLQRVTVTKTPLGPDRGYAFSTSSSADLLQISQLILKLTRELVSLVDSGSSSGSGSSGGPTLRDFELVRKLAELRQAVRQRRQLQMAQAYDQAVDEMLQEEAEATRQGREPTQQVVQQRVGEADREIERQRAAIDQVASPPEAPKPPDAPAAPADPPPPNPPPTQPTSEPNPESEDRITPADLESVLRMIDPPGGKTEPPPSNAKIAVDFLEEALAEKEEAEEAVEEDDIPWIDVIDQAMEGKVYEKPASVVAAENAQLHWQYRKAALRMHLQEAKQTMNSAWRSFNSDLNEQTRQLYDNSVKARDEAQQNYDNHLKAQPKRTTP